MHVILVKIIGRMVYLSIVKLKCIVFILRVSLDSSGHLAGNKMIFMNLIHDFYRVLSFASKIV